MLKRLILLLLLVLMFTGSASAAEYYLATTGSNANGGESIAGAWLTPSYAVAQLEGGDTLWVVDGYYYEPVGTEVEAHQYGNATHWTRVVAYNGTPIFDGDNASARGFRIGESPDPYYVAAYTHVEGITVTSYRTGIIYIERVTDVRIINCTFSNSSVSTHPNPSNWRSIMDLGDGVANITITGCNFNDSSNFGINLMGDRNATDGLDTVSYNIVVDNCYFNRTYNHDALQIGNYCYNVTVSNCTFIDCYGGAGTYFHEIEAQPNRQQDITIRDNTFTDNKHYAVFLAGTKDSLVENNTITNAGKSAFIVCYYADNVLIKGNTVINATRMYDDNVGIRSNIDLIFEDNIYDEKSEAEDYYGRAGGMLTIRNDRHKPSYRVEIRAGDQDAWAIFEQKDCRMLRHGAITNPSGSNWSVTEPRYYPGLSNYTIFSNHSRLYWETYTYNTTIKPQGGYIHSASVIQESNPADDEMRILASSSTGTDANPTRITSLMQQAENTYSVYADTMLAGRWVSDADGIMKYQHDAAWTAGMPITFDWYSVDSYSGPPDVANLSYVAGPAWVLHTWDPGDGSIVTDSYNRSVNGTWFNGSSFTYIIDETVPELGWSDIVIYAWNDTYGLSQFYEVNNAQALAIPWSLDTMKAYYNFGSPITITSLGYGNHTNVYSRVIVEADTICSFRMDVAV